MISITVQGENADQLRTELGLLLGFQQTRPAPITVQPPQATVSTPTANSPSVAPEVKSPFAKKSSSASPSNAPSSEVKKGRGRPPQKNEPAASVVKPVVAAPVQPPPAPKSIEKVETPPSPPAGEASAPTKEQAVAALKAITDKFGGEAGIPIARDVLSRFGCARVAEVPVSEYPKFIEACAQAVAHGAAQ